ncbi:MAG: SGNH/GDSL hydrolase family protein [Muribaculaceae bacterium]|nr:SGNH/GDSL hydrolase family protein [Muribaculaceae bacterium]
MSISKIKNRLCLLALMAVAACTAFATTNDSDVKVVAILGDSYSTYRGHNPEGYATWYYDNPEPDRTDVTDVEQTWWRVLAKEGGYAIGENDSFSGATVSNRGYRGQDFTDRSFITRLPRVGKPDILLIFGGTNDSWAGVPVGEYDYSDSIPAASLYEFRPAMCRLLSDARKLYPDTKVYFIINSELREDITESVKEVCRHYSVPYIQLHDIEKMTGHPSVKGMQAIARQVLEVLSE